MINTIEHLLERYIYTITTVCTEKNYRNTRCVGWVSENDEAYDIVTNNHGDIAESGYYQYAIIEQMGEGLYYTPKEEFWFEWNADTKKYDPIDTPKEFKNVTGFGMG